MYRRLSVEKHTDVEFEIVYLDNRMEEDFLYVYKVVYPGGTYIRSSPSVDAEKVASMTVCTTYWRQFVFEKVSNPSTGAGIWPYFYCQQKPISGWD